MKPLSDGRAQQKFSALLKIAQSRYGDYRKLLLADLLERFLPLADVEEAAYNQLRQQIQSREVEQMISIYEERGIEKGRLEGRVEGREEGVRATLLRQGTRKFGEPSRNTLRQLSTIHDLTRLEELADRILDANNWEELLAG
ncbi:DUF4351 domain-containing protein [Armatimonas sp.]|uniref:DUF4351 domain-containing protein n=1 Tax=Armatimonas sp. TaxID=1872638 RepID=UPI00286A1969|nr:DUF4351 domain-containing protein [Armatimonas sp.]